MQCGDKGEGEEGDEEEEFKASVDWWGVGGIAPRGPSRGRFRIKRG